MFSLGTAEARAAGLRAAATLPDAPAGAVPAAEEPIDRALTTVAGALAVVAVSPGVLRCTPREVTAAGLMSFGAEVHRLRAALAAEGLASTVTYEATTAVVAVFAA
jgi:coenzyme F420-0:L-glutamate ligase/coenzyme F420-1:gamma-L-glutamate ligase